MARYCSAAEIPAFSIPHVAGRGMIQKNRLVTPPILHIAYYISITNSRRPWNRKCVRVRVRMWKGSPRVGRARVCMCGVCAHVCVCACMACACVCVHVCVCVCVCTWKKPPPALCFRLLVKSRHIQLIPVEVLD